jgi:hypothetical protein
MDTHLRSPKWVQRGSVPLTSILGEAQSSSSSSSSSNSFPSPDTLSSVAKAAAPPPAPPSSSSLAPVTSYRDRQYVKLLLDSEVVDSEALKKLSWNGVPGHWRPQVWQLLLAYLPSDKKRRETTLRRKRQEYADAVASHFDAPEASFDRTTQEQKMLRQILVDVPRTSPDVPLFHQPKVQRCLERLLYIWAIRHPASGYVQGMNDLATPLFVVFLSAALIPASSPLTSEPRAGADIPELYASGFRIESRGSKYGGRCELTAAVESLDAQRLPLELLDRVEADTYW